VKEKAPAPPKQALPVKKEMKIGDSSSDEEDKKI